MLAVVHSIALVGLLPQLVRVEVQSGRGPATFDIVGMPESVVRESRIRVRAALAQVGVPLHSHALTANLAPADLPKLGSAFDLALAIATLGAIGAVPLDRALDTAFVGELSLDGGLRGVRGVLARLLGARELGLVRVIVPKDNTVEAGVLDETARATADERGSDPPLEVHAAGDLNEVLAYLRGEGSLARTSGRVEQIGPPSPDLADVRGQPAARRVLEVAAAGGHDLVLVGPPGAGKTMLASRLPSLLPVLSDGESLEITALHSVAGLLPEGHGLLRNRPFRAPHHSVSEAGLLGGGNPPRPGEISLAHHGVLFLDELLEFRRPALDGLRQPLEDGVIRIARSHARATFPARPQLVCAMNPCPCGYAGDRVRVCRCTPDRVRSYRARLSGPLVDRIDIHVAVPPVSLLHLADDEATEGSAAVRARVEVVRRVARERNRVVAGAPVLNARLAMTDLLKVAKTDAGGRAVLTDAMERLGLSARAYGKVLRVARTLADMEGQDCLAEEHVAEAIDYRLLDRQVDDAA